MTTRAREVEALRELASELQVKARDYAEAADECNRRSPMQRRYTEWSALANERASALSALIAECEAAKAELAEAVKVMNALADKVKGCDAASGSIFAVAAIHGCKYRGPTWIAELSDASAFIAKHTPPQPVPVGEEKGETK